MMCAIFAATQRGDCCVVIASGLLRKLVLIKWSALSYFLVFHLYDCFLSILDIPLLPPSSYPHALFTCWLGQGPFT